MVALIILHCPNHPKKVAEYWIYVGNKGYGFCKDCFKWLGKIHQLVIE